MIVVRVATVCAALCIAQLQRGALPVLPAGTLVSVRLLTAIAGTTSAHGDVVRALVIAPVGLIGRDALVANDTLMGVVRDAGVEQGAGKRHFILLDFTRLLTRDGASLPLRAVVADVPNAREIVDSTGRITGPERPGTLRSPGNWAATLLASTNPIAGVVFFAAFRGEDIERHRRIKYGVGTELTVRLTGPLTLATWPLSTPMPAATPDERAAFSAVPLRATTAHDNLPADVVTLGIVATDSALLSAFRNAGWTTPERSSLKADIETLASAARAAGFTAQPVSTLLLDGASPAFVFEKVVNSMARRHHLRIWRWGLTGDGRQRWLVAASRDDGVLFSEQRRFFGHRVDPAIDVERQKVINDLLTDGSVVRLTMLARQAPTTQTVVNGDTPIQTDWQLALLVLRSATP